MDIIEKRKRSITADTRNSRADKRTTIRVPEPLKAKLRAYRELTRQEYSERLDDMLGNLDEADIHDQSSTELLTDAKDLLQGPTSKVTITLSKRSQESLEKIIESAGVTRDEAMTFAILVELKAYTEIYRKHLLDLGRINELFQEVFEKAHQWLEIDKLCASLEPLENDFASWEYSPDKANALWDDISNDLERRMEEIRECIVTIDSDGKDSTRVDRGECAKESIPTHTIRRRNVKAWIRYESGEWWLLPPSRPLARTTTSMPDHTREQREECLDKGLLVMGDKPTHYLVVDAVKFNSSSALACFVMATSESGPRCVKKIRAEEKETYEKLNPEG